MFGPLQVIVEGAPLARLRTRKGEWLLALLALRGGRKVDRSWLAGTLWPESGEGRAFASLRKSLTDLRRALGPQAARLHAPTPQSLLLDLTDATVDVAAFDRAIACGDTASLEGAVALYRGPLLEGCCEEWVLPERLAREEAYLSARERLAALALEQGETAKAERHLRLAVAVDPLREGTQRALMQVLAASGNYAAALRAYRELRLHLHRELNTPPDAETQTLFQQLRSEARRLATKGLAARWPAIEGSGEREGGKETDAGPAQSAVPQSDGRIGETASRDQRLPRLHNLPVERSILIGREQEVAAARDLLRCDEVGLLTLTGPGGTGKTRLALHVAATLLPEFEHGVFFVPLAPVRDSALVASAVAQTLRVQETGSYSLVESLKGYLRDKQLLLLLDNFEQVLEAAPLVAELLAAAPQLKVLVTSRAVLHLRNEKELSIPPLALPNLNHLPLHEALLRYAAVELFLERARDLKPEFELTQENAPAIAAICARLDGLPLALELAAPRLKLFSPQQLLARLEHRLPLLTGGPRDLPARQRTLRDTIAWSYDLLAPHEQRLIRRLSVFARGCSLEAAEAVCAEADLWVPDGIASLIDSSLIRKEDGADGEPRFTMLETIREFARERLAESGEQDAVRQQHAAFFLALAEEAEPELWRDPSWGERLEIEHDNLRAALDWCAAARNAGRGNKGPAPWTLSSPITSDSTGLVLDPAELALRLAGALGDFWFVRGHYAEARQRLAGALLESEHAPVSVRARTLSRAAMAAVYAGDFVAAVAQGEASMALARQDGDKAIMAYSLRAMSEATFKTGDRDRGIALDEESIALCREIGDRLGEAGALTGLGCWLYDLGEKERGVALVTEALAISRATGYRRQTASILRNLAGLEMHRGHAERAIPLLHEAWALLREFGDRVEGFGALHGLVRASHAVGDAERVAALLDDCLVALQESGMPNGASMALLHLATVAEAQGDQPRRKALLEQSLINARSGGNRECIAHALLCLAKLAHDEGDPARAQVLAREAYALFKGTDAVLCVGHLLLDLGDYAAARARYEEGLALRRAVNDPAGIAWALLDLGHAAWLQGDLAAAEASAIEALQRFRALENCAGVVAVLESLAVAALAQGQLERAARLMGAAAAQRERLRPVEARGWWDGRPLARVRAAAANARLEEQCAETWEAGQAMSLEAAIQSALQTPFGS